MCERGRGVRGGEGEGMGWEGEADGEGGGERGRGGMRWGKREGEAWYGRTRWIWVVDAVVNGVVGWSVWIQMHTQFQKTPSLAAFCRVMAYEFQILSLRPYLPHPPILFRLLHHHQALHTHRHHSRNHSYNLRIRLSTPLNKAKHRIIFRSFERRATIRVASRFSIIDGLCYINRLGGNQPRPTTRIIEIGTYIVGETILGAGKGFLVFDLFYL